VLLGLDAIFVTAPSNAWDMATAPDVALNWDMSRELPRQEKVLGAVPGESSSYFFKTREGALGLLQIIGFAGNHHAVKIRYKLVQTEEAKPARRPPVSAAAFSGPPKLRFLAWQDAWQTNHPAAARQPDGSPVTNAEELKWLKAVPAGGVQSWLSSPAPRFLKLWFSHPALDANSICGITLLDGQNQPIVLGAGGSSFGSEQDANEYNGQLGWYVSTLSPDLLTNAPKALTVRLAYALGPLENPRTVTVAPGQNVGMTLEGNGQLNGIGQSVDGNAFVSLAYDAAKLRTRKFGAIAVAKDGRELTGRGSGSGNGDGTGVRVEEFVFDLPLSDVARFIIGTRPIRTTEWKNVVLPGKGHR
jgi:hypothetical protein